MLNSTTFRGTQLILEARLGLGDPAISPGERMVAIIIELLGTGPQA